MLKYLTYNHSTVICNELYQVLLMSVEQVDVAVMLYGIWEVTGLRLSHVSIYSDYGSL